MHDQPIPRIHEGGNPFAAEWTRPGAIPFLFPEALNAEELVVTLRQHAWKGQIVGPHGSGKSTLLETLVPHLEKASRNIRRSTQHAGETVPDWESLMPRSWNDATVVIIDGWEQLSWWSRLRVRHWVGRRKSGLLVTSHREAGLPDLFRPQPTLDTAARIVAHLMTGRPDQAVIGTSEIAAAMDAHGGNIRECLFTLYDHYEG